MNQSFAVGLGLRVVLYLCPLISRAEWPYSDSLIFVKTTFMGLDSFPIGANIPITSDLFEGELVTDEKSSIAFPITGRPPKSHSYETKQRHLLDIGNGDSCDGCLDGIFDVNQNHRFSENGTPLRYGDTIHQSSYFAISDSSIPGIIQFEDPVDRLLSQCFTIWSIWREDADNQRIGTPSFVPPDEQDLLSSYFVVKSETDVDSEGGFLFPTRGHRSPWDFPSLDIDFERCNLQDRAVGRPAYWPKGIWERSEPIADAPAVFNDTLRATVYRNTVDIRLRFQPSQGSCYYNIRFVVIAENIKTGEFFLNDNLQMEQMQEEQGQLFSLPPGEYTVFLSNYDEFCGILVDGKRIVRVEKGRSLELEFHNKDESAQQVSTGLRIAHSPPRHSADLPFFGLLRVESPRGSHLINGRHLPISR